MAINKVVYDGETLIDLTGDTVTEGTLVKGATAHNAAGVRITGTAEYAAVNHTHDAASTSVNGFMSSTDKAKLDGIASGANNYSHPGYTAKSSGFYKVAVDSTGHVSGTAAVAKSDITGLGIPAQDTTYSAATTSAAGLMSASDKSKLDGIATGATKVTVDSALSSSSTNPVQNKVVNSALAGKADTSAIPTKTSQLTNDSGFKTTDTNTTYTFATGDSNGQIKVTPSGGSAQNVSVKGLGTAAYTASTAYATAAQGTLASNALPKAGGTLTGALTAYGGSYGTAQVRNVFFGTSDQTAGASSSYPEGTMYFSIE